MKKIIPTIFAHNKKQFLERFKKLVKLGENLQVDFMDGKFVREKSVRLIDIPTLKNYRIKFEAHLMVKNPNGMIETLKRKSFKKIIIHLESFKNLGKLERTIDKIKGKKIDCWVAVNPGSGLVKINNLLDKIDGVLFMGVNPGKEGQKFIKKVYKKIIRFKKLYPKVKTQVDGGVNLKTLVKLRKIGVDYFNSGGFISQSENPKKALSELRKSLKI